MGADGGALVLTEPGLKLSLRGEELVLLRGAGEALAARLQDLQEVVALGPVEFSAGALHALLERGIDVLLMTGAGRYRGRVAGPGSRHAERRLAQYRRVSDPHFALATARRIVQGKVSNQRSLLLQAQQSLRDEAVAEALGRLRRAEERAGRAESMDALRGEEGSAAAAYFGVLGTLIRNPAFGFTERTRRPPRDPVNACLSFGYAFLGSLLEGVVQRAGLDPLLGFLHEPVRGRSSLVLDLLEEFRAPVVDSTVLRTINRRQLTPGDFRMPGLEDRAAAVLEGEEPSDPMPAEAVYLGPSGRKVFLAELLARLREEVRYEPRDERRSYRAILLEQAQSMSRAVEGDSDGYRPFAWR